MSFRVPSDQVPLAWRNLTAKKERLALSVLGVSFAVVIMFAQLGIFNSTVDSAVVIIDKLNADLLIVNKLKTFVANTEPFSRRRIYQAMGVPGVESVYPLYIESDIALWKNPQDDKTYAIRVLGFDLQQQVLRVPEIYKYAEQLRLPETVIIDRRSSRNFYGDFCPGMRTELADKKLTIIGEFTLGRDFIYQGTAVISDKNFAEIFDDGSGQSRLDEVEIGLIKVAADAEIEKIQAELQHILPDDVAVYTVEQFIALETIYWVDINAIGDVFYLGVLLGFGIGVLICYQILYSDIMLHLKQFATLKALGFTNGFLFRVILQQALFLSIFGFTCGFIISNFLYKFLEKQMEAAVPMKEEIVVSLLILTVFMCIAAGVIAARKALMTDPAELF